jgi:hypothetical protein
MCDDINIPIHKGLKAKRIAEDRPDLSLGEIARIVDTHPGNVANAPKRDYFGRDKPKIGAMIEAPLRPPIMAATGGDGSFRRYSRPPGAVVMGAQACRT